MRECLGGNGIDLSRSHCGLLHGRRMQQQLSQIEPGVLRALGMAGIDRRLPSLCQAGQGCRKRPKRA